MTPFALFYAQIFLTLLCGTSQYRTTERSECSTSVRSVENGISACAGTNVGCLTLNHLQWRIEAWRTHRSNYGEIYTNNTGDAAAPAETRQLPALGDPHHAVLLSAVCRSASWPSSTRPRSTPNGTPDVTTQPSPLPPAPRSGP